MDLALSEVGRRIIDAVIDAPVAWRTPVELAERLGWTLEQTQDEIATLDAAGWLEAWELIDGPVVTLSVAATANCGVRLVEVGHNETPKWARSGDPDPPSLKSSGVFRSERAAALNLVADARPSVEFAAIEAEESADLAATTPDPARPRSVERWPRPTLLIGGGLSPWPGPREADDQDCPACRLAHLPAQAYCLWCDRWGLDILTPEPRVTRPRSHRQPIAGVHQFQPDVGKHESERRKRRRKRKERRLVQVQQERISPPRDRARWGDPPSPRVINL